MEKEIIVSGVKYIIRELKYKDLTGMGTVGTEQAAKDIMKKASSMTEEQYDDLSLKDGLEIQKVINELNGFANFQNPLTAKN